MNTLPCWIQIGQALLTPAIAIGVAVIAFMQWRTAHQRFVLDLFERRMEVYEQVRRVVARINSSGQADQEADRDFLPAIEKALFLFGDDVSEYLKEMRQKIILLQENSNTITNFGPHERKNAIQQRTDLFRSITKFYYDGPELFGRYLRMPHRSIRNPVQWFRDSLRDR